MRCNMKTATTLLCCNARSLVTHIAFVAGRKRRSPQSERTRKRPISVCDYVASHPASDLDGKSAEKPPSRPSCADFRVDPGGIDIKVFDQGATMAMFDFAVLAIKALCLIWIAQLIWLGSLFLRRPVKRILRSIVISVDTPSKKLVRALRSDF